MTKKSDLRSAARLAASQALYQMEVAETGVDDIVAEFEAHWIGQEIEGDAYNPAELAFFRDVVRGVLRDQVRIDRGLDETLQQGWPLKRVEALMRAILRAAYYELRSRTDVPARVVVTEYVDIAAAFFGPEESGMVNAVLDALARQVRPEEFAARRGQSTRSFRCVKTPKRRRLKFLWRNVDPDSLRINDGESIWMDVLLLEQA